jgi:hypothetical protein
MGIITVPSCDFLALATKSTHVVFTAAEASSLTMSVLWEREEKTEETPSLSAPYCTISYTDTTGGHVLEWRPCLADP